MRGTLYTFEADGPPRFVNPDRVGLTVTRSSGDRFARVAATFDNAAADHRLQVVVAPLESGATTRAGSIFEIVERPPVGEGGDSEPPPRQWPARGHVTWDGITILTEGVVEYEVTEEGLALTLLRCVGTISRSSLRARARAAGPDVRTPEAQMLGRHEFTFVVMEDAGNDVIACWERFALGLLSTESRGAGRPPAGGVLLELDVPALSTITRSSGPLEVRVWNPWDQSVRARAGDVEAELGPFRIETLRLS